MSSAPLVSVVMPAYNAAAFLREAVASVLSQTWRELELLLVDDGSTDATGAVADELAAADSRVRVIHQANAGHSEAKNAGLRAARGEYLCFLDSDDAYLPDKVERQVGMLRLFGEVDLVFSDYYLGSPGLAPTILIDRRPPAMPMAEVLLYLNWFGPPLSVTLRMSVQRKVGLFDPDLGASEDWDFWLRASRCGSFAYLPGPVGVYRQHPGQTIKNRARMRQNQEKVIGKAFPAGSAEWRAAKAARDYTDAQWSFARRDWVGTALALGRCAWRARSRRTLKRIRTLYRT